jgi:hypothetical protein
MTITADHLTQSQGAATPLAQRLGMLAVALTFLFSFYVKIEPAICDLLFFASLAFFYRTGLRLSPAIMPLFFLLLIYNVAGLVSYLTIDYDPYGSWQFVMTSFYMGFSAVFYAAFVAADPEARFQYIMKFYRWGATLAAALGLAGYFHLVPDSLDFVVYSRMVSGFKDPNVFSTYLVLPAVFTIQGLMLGKLRLNLANLASLFALLMAIVLAFSRGAWIDFTLSSILMIGMTIVLSPEGRQRGGLLVKAVVAVGVIVLVLVALLSIKETAHLFWDRFTLVKEYDAGEMGRFGNQKNAIPMLLVRPLGFGPLQFTKYFIEAPHNTFLNAFSSFGWAGGLAFMALVVSNIFVGLQLVLRRSPFQASAIAVYASLLAMTFQGVQIDTEHWRHLYWMMGLLWGLFAAMADRGRLPWPKSSILQGWNGGRSGL